MTIREYLRRRYLKVTAVCLTLGCVPSLLTVHYAPDNTRQRDWSYAIFWAAVAINVLIVRMTPCPRCRVPLGAAGGRLFTRRWLIDSCPYCGMSFDAQYQFGHHSHPR